MALKRKPPEGNVRRVQSHGNNLRGVITNKAGRIVQYESFLERSLLLRLDRDRRVTDYLSQAERMKYFDSRGQLHFHTADYKVMLVGGAIELHEAVRFQLLNSDTYQERAQRIGRIADARGWRHIIHTEQSLPQGPELANLLALLKYRPLVYGNDQISYVTNQILKQSGLIALSDLITKVSDSTSLPESTARDTLFHLLWHDVIATDLNKPLFTHDVRGRKQIEVWLSEEDRE